MSGGADRCREDLGSDKESDTVGAELVEERGQEVHGLETVNVLRRREVVQSETGDDEENKVSQETDDHHPFAPVKLVVDEQGSEVVATKRYTDVDQVIQPAGHDRLVTRRNNADEFVLEKLVAVEENVVGKPSAGSSQKTGSKVCKGKFQRLNVVAGNVRLLLGKRQLPRSRFHLVVTEVDEP